MCTDSYNDIQESYNNKGGIMIRIIAQKEILQILKSFKFTIITLLILVSMMSSLFIMYNDFTLRRDNYSILLPKENKKIAVIAPTPLSIFVKGLDETMGKSFRIGFGGQIEPGRTQQSANNIFKLFTAPDMLYIIKVILSLCAIIFSFDMISGEKAIKTLPLSLSNSVNRTKLLTGKWIGGFSSLIIPFFMMFLLALIVVLLSPRVQLEENDLAKLCLFFLGALIYLAFFFSIGLFISANTTRPPSSLVISLFAWTLIVFVAPNLGNTVARQLYPVPSIQQFEMRRNHIWIKEIFTLAQARKTDASYTRDKTISIINTENDMVRSDYYNRFATMIEIAKKITRISPSAAFTYFATDIACTGIREDMKLKQAVIRYKDTVFSNSSGNNEVLPNDVPRFSFVRSSVHEVMSNEGFLNLLVLVLFAIAAFSATYVSFLRYDVR